jgi:hypothetical protein
VATGKGEREGVFTLAEILGEIRNALYVSGEGSFPDGQ